MTHYLKALQLSKIYKDRRVVKNVTLDIEDKQITGLLGPNGAGKTTIFYMIVGLTKPDVGSIKLDDVDMSHLPIDKRAHLGISYLPQEPSIFRKLTVAENILAILELQESLNTNQRKEELDRLLEEFHITALRDSMGYTLSGGERRRVEIARSLATQPKFILLDEPFAGIDPISVVDIKTIIRHLKNRGLGVLITDHNVREALDICDRAYVVNEGEVICVGNAEAILNNQLVREVYLGQEFEL